MDYNAADEKQVRDRQNEIKNEREQELEDIKELLSYPAGVRFFRRMFVEGRVFSTTFTGNSQTFFNEGARALALKYFADVADAAPRKLPEVITEEKK